MTIEQIFYHSYIMYLLGDWKHGNLVRTYLCINKIAPVVRSETLDNMIDYLLTEKVEDEYGIQLAQSVHLYTFMTFENIIGCRKRIFRINKIVTHIKKVKRRINTYSTSKCDELLPDAGKRL